MSNVAHEKFSPTQINDQQLENSIQNFKKPSSFRSFRLNFSLLSKTHHKNDHDENISRENCHQKLTFLQRLDMLRRSFHIGKRNLSHKHHTDLLSDE